MNTRLRPVGALAICALLVSMVFTSADATQSPATTIKRKGGQVTRGEIKGLIVQGQTGDVSEGSLSGHGALYFVVEGKDIEAIDEEGIHYKRARYILVGQKGTPDPIEILETYVKFTNGDMMASLTYSGRHDGASVQVDSIETTAPVRLKLLGEFRMEDSKRKLIPALEINTGKGVVSIPVEEIVEFRKPSGGPN